MGALKGNGMRLDSARELTEMAEYAVGAFLWTDESVHLPETEDRTAAE